MSDYKSEKYNPHEIEKKWQKRWDDEKIYEVDLNDDSKEKYYFLTMYPYPSGDLHVGHWYAEAPADAAARYKRMQGFNVFFPIGYDSFGLPAENAAVRAAKEGKNVHPATLTYSQIDRMDEQFKQMGAMFDWSKKIVTCDPEYYKWNQWFFIEMFKRGLAYKKHSPVDFCPSCNTTLAREQVVGEDRLCERCGSSVIKKELSQWYFKITEYADELLNFEGLDWPKRVREMQTNWIGRSEGAKVSFSTKAGDLDVFTTRPDTLWGATFMVIAPEHPFVNELTSDEQKQEVAAYVEAAERKTEIERQAEGKEKSGVFTGSYAINPVNGNEIPIWIADYVLMGYGTGAIMAVPAHDQRDFEFARKFGLEVIPVIIPKGETFDGKTMTEAYVGDGLMANSAEFDGTPAGKESNHQGIKKVISFLEEKGIGEKQIIYRLRDWLVSRQRYWGTPIPMIYCKDCGTVPVDQADLPVELPSDIEFMPTGESPLKSHVGFLNTTCPNCGKPAKRETDTLDTFIDSSWYWFRYLSPNKDDAPMDKSLVADWTPVKTYTGGIEHAILHLLYSRFFTKVIRDLGFIDYGEPFLRLRNQGMILGEDSQKMSKSRGNVVNPDELVKDYGADVVRTYLMFLGPWDQGAPWNYQAIEGSSRFLNRLWALVLEEAKDRDVSDDDKKQLRFAVHNAIKEVSEDFENFRFNTAIAEMMTLINAMNKLKGSSIVKTDEWQFGIESLIKMVAPVAPHIAEELWDRTGHKGFVHLEGWPDYDESALKKDSVKMAVQVNGKVRAEIEVPAEADKDEILAIAKSDEKVSKYLSEGTIVREIVVPKRLVNFVVKS